MVNPLVSSSTLTDLQQRAAHHFEMGEYDHAAAIYEDLVESYPGVRSAYWHLGLIRLVQGQEADAQVIWLMAIAEGDSYQVEQWTQELFQVLQFEAECQERAGNNQTAWVIRQHMREIFPGDSSNLLLLVELLLKLETFNGEALTHLGLIEQLQTEQPSNLDTKLLFQVLKQLLEQAELDESTVADFVEACLPYSDNAGALVDLLLPHTAKLHERSRNGDLAYRYANLCFKLDSDRPDVIHRLCCICQDTRQYADGIELARRYYATCQTTVQKIKGNALLLRGLMNTGTRWQEAEDVLHQQTELFHTLLADQEGVEQSFDVSVVCVPSFFYPYFSDNPQENRSLQNDVAKLYQSGLDTYLKKHVTDYQPYPNAALVRSVERKTLRVGYLSRFLHRHSIGWLCRWLFKYFDRDRFEVYAYFVQPTKLDDFSNVWFTNKATRACTFEDDPLEIAKAIREDEIDILVDLDSLTSHPVCEVMALKPAPVQITWLGLDAVGLPTIDYFFADPYVLPENAQPYYTEQIWRLPQSYISVDGFEVAVPTLRRDELEIPEDAIVYLSAQFAYKRHPNTMRLQMQILQQVSNSYFLVKGAGDEQSIKALFERQAAEAGVNPDRLRFLPRDRDEETHRANLAIADVILDTFPYNGATTTLETLWLGIPMVTRVGQQFAARNSYTMMVNAGITEGIAWTDTEYVEWGVRLGNDAALRQQISLKLLRSRQTAPLWNGKQFTREVELAYEQMWKIYLKGQRSQSSPISSI